MTKALSKTEYLQLASSIGSKKAPPMRRPGHPEADEQAKVVAWARRNESAFPGLWLLHCSLNGVKLSKAQAGIAKGQGMLSGVPDLFLPYPCGKYVGLYIEMKHGKNKPTPEQQAFMTGVQPWYRAAVCWSADEAIAVIRDYYAVQ